MFATAGCGKQLFIVSSIVMVSIPDTHELLLTVCLIAGFSVVLVQVQSSLPSFSPEVLVATPQVSPREPRVLGASTAIPLVANPVVHVTLPERSIFAPQ
jgi:hypothetical protein